MPIYIFKCEKCNNMFEVFQKNPKDSFECSCPECRSTKVKKCIAPTSFILKGNCWARDNYSKKKTA